MSPLEAGGLLIARAAAMAVMSTVTSLVVIRKYGYRRPMMVGFVALAIGLLLLSAPVTSSAGLVWLSLACVVCGLGVGLAGPPSNNAALELMPSDVAAISGLRATFRQIGSIIAISISGAIIAGSAQGTGVLPYVFAVLGILIATAVPFIAAVPESERRATLSV